MFVCGNGGGHPPKCLYTTEFVMQPLAQVWFLSMGELGLVY